MWLNKGQCARQKKWSPSVDKRQPKQKGARSGHGFGLLPACPEKLSACCRQFLVPRPGIEPGLRIRTKQDQIHQKKSNDFGLFRPTALPRLAYFRLVFRLNLPKFCPRISRLLDLKPDIFYAFVRKDT